MNDTIQHLFPSFRPKNDTTSVQKKSSVPRLQDQQESNQWEITIWKEINSRLPAAQDALHEFLKYKDGSKSIVPKRKKDKRNSKTLFISKIKNGKRYKPEFIDPETRSVTFAKSSGVMNVGLDKKRLKISWIGDVKCNNKGDEVTCSLISKDVVPTITSSVRKERKFSDKKAIKKVLKPKKQTREILETNELDLWSEPVLHVRDLNQVALFGTSGILATAASSGLLFLPALGILLVSSPMMIGATALANGEAITSNKKGAWYVKGMIDQEKWINDMKIPPEKIESVTVFQDDEYYQHVKIKLDQEITCKITEESNVLSFYPNRRLECE